MSDHAAWAADRQRQRQPSTPASFPLVEGMPHPNSPGERALFAAQQAEGRLVGFHFNRRVGPYVVDLVDYEARLVVEVDGFTYHEADPERAEADKRRDRALVAAGYRVLRFSGVETTRETPKVVDEIEAVARKKPDAVVEREVIRLREPTPREQINRLVQRMSRYRDLHGGPGSGARWAREINREIKRRFGPAHPRADDQHVAALDWLDDLWTRYRAEHGIRESDVPAHDADVRPQPCCSQAEPVTCCSCAEVTGQLCPEHLEQRGWLVFVDDDPRAGEVVLVEAACPACVEVLTPAGSMPECARCTLTPQSFDELCSWSGSGGFLLCIGCDDYLRSDT